MVVFFSIVIAPILSFLFIGLIAGSKIRTLELENAVLIEKLKLHKQNN
jgi:hypothetical protein